MKRQNAQRKKVVKQVKDKANRYSKSAAPWCATLKLWVSSDLYCCEERQSTKARQKAVSRPAPG
jgi:hypothetical protein